MTTTETTLRVGPELDAAVAEALGDPWPLEYLTLQSAERGLVCISYDLQGGKSLSRFINRVLPPYSTDIAAAWVLVENMRDIAPSIFWRIDPPSPGGGFWVCDFIGPHNHEGFWAPTAPEAICRAFLAAKGHGAAPAE